MVQQEKKVMTFEEVPISYPEEEEPEEEPYQDEDVGDKERER